MAPPSRADATLLPALLAGLLVLMALAQLLLTGAPELPEAGPIGGALRQRELPEPRQGMIPPVIAARPLFAPRGGLPGSTTTDGTTAAPEDQLGGAAIAGTIAVGRRIYAVVQLPQGRQTRVPVGGRIGGWRVTALSASGARLVRGGERLFVPFGARTASQNSTTATDGQELQP